MTETRLTFVSPMKVYLFAWYVKIWYEYDQVCAKTCITQL